MRQPRRPVLKLETIPDMDLGQHDPLPGLLLDDELDVSCPHGRIEQNKNIVRPEAVVGE